LLERVIITSWLICYETNSVSAVIWGLQFHLFSC
jgi:hypothetical protein